MLKRFLTFPRKHGEYFMSSLHFIGLMTSVSCVDRRVRPECQNLASKLSYHKQNQKITLHVCEILHTCCLLDPHTPPLLLNLLTMLTMLVLKAQVLESFKEIFLYSPEFPLNLELQPTTLGTFSCRWICHSISPTKYRRLPDPACHVVKQKRPCCEVTETYEKK